MSKQAFPAGAFIFGVIFVSAPLARVIRRMLSDWSASIQVYLAGWVTWKDLIIALILACWFAVVVAEIYVWLIDSICELFKWPYASHRLERALSVGLTAITFPFMVWGILLFSYAMADWNWNTSSLGWDWNAPIFETEKERPSLEIPTDAPGIWLRLDAEGNLMEMIPVDSDRNEP